jgi:pyrimidine-nucleoside phosphorylase
MLVLGEVAADSEDGRRRIRGAIADGSGLEKLRAIVGAQGGDPASVDARDRLPTARHEAVLEAPRAGVLAAMDVEAIGRSAMLLGAGRARTDDVIDLAVGYELEVRLGDRIEAGQPLVRVAYNDEARWASARAVLGAAFQLGDAAVEPSPLIRERA